MLSEGNTVEPDRDKFEDLRLILEAEQHRAITYDEALDVGQSLISFFEVLADDSHANQEIFTESMI